MPATLRSLPDGGVGGGDRAPAPEAGALLGGRDPVMPLSRPVEVNAVTLAGPDGPELHATWSWPDGVLTEPDVRALASTQRLAASRQRLADQADHRDA